MCHSHRIRCTDEMQWCREASLGADYQHGEPLLLYSFPLQTRPALTQIYEGNAVTLVQAVLTSAVESGINTFLFPAQHHHLAQEWKGIVDFDALLCGGDAIHANNQQVFYHC